ncbi:MAG TPA: sodium:proton antiporter, partial [Isosphaeraceae bacterium]|nr:sodium:proton antiporter [Isosphaeraceae bacterium]
AQVPHVLWSLPFGILLLLIATLPLVHAAHHWWERNSVKLAVGLILGAIVLVHYGTRGFGFPHDGHATKPGLPTVIQVVEHAILGEYIPFIVLLFSLYVVAGGLQLRGDLLALPRVNTGILALGAIMASFVGTTGASMVLIRPLLQTNRDRKYVVHTVVFFIFLVSNIGGCLLPIGDPPLFLGYLAGVPFLWTMKLVLPWAFTVCALLLIYYVWDRVFAFPREDPALMSTEQRHFSPLRLHGKINLLWLLGVVLAVALIVPGKPLPGTEIMVRDFVREAVMLLLAGLSLATTPRGLRKEVEFDYTAILEVAALFLGIFLTMQVPIEILQANGQSLALNQPWHFFWATGALSSFLDNAPTYVVFFETARSLPLNSAAQVVPLVGGGQIGQAFLRAISLGAVFMGANTYIGNGPNFMVKSIAEGHGVKMPSFGGYMLYSLGVLVPLFLVVTLIFFR